jgi:hypothetical protein
MMDRFIDADFYINGEFATTYRFYGNKNLIDFLRIFFEGVDSKIIKLPKTSTKVPSVGMKYYNEEFLSGDNGENLVDPNTEFAKYDTEIYALIMNDKVYHVYPVLPQDQELVAIFDSNPTFVIS